MNRKIDLIFVENLPILAVVVRHDRPEISAKLRDNVRPAFSGANLEMNYRKLSVD